MNTKIKYFALGLSALLFISAQALKDIKIKNQVFEVNYSQTLEQPLELVYRSTNRVTNVNRGSMDFWVDPKIKTSDGKDYEKNVYDKGHLAPAATFSDNMDNLKTTFSYLNCALQNQYLNRGVWRMLEIQERDLAKKYEVKVKIVLDFNGKCEVLTSGATVPVGFFKYITFNKTTLKYYFGNEKPVSPNPEHYLLK